MAKKEAREGAAAESIFTPAVAELVAIGAAIAANCEPCFKHHYNEARRLGVSREDMAAAVVLADQVKRAPAQNMLTLAERILRTEFAAQETTQPPAACCSAAEPSKPGKCKGR